MFQHMLKGQRNGAHLVVVDPRRTASARWAERARRPPRGLGHRPRERHRARRHRRGPPARLVHREQHARLRGVPGVGRRSPPPSGRSARPASPPSRSGGSPGATRRPTAPSFAGRSGSPSTTTRSTTSTRSSIWPSSPATSAGWAPGSIPCGARTTSRAAATWARCRSAARLPGRLRPRKAAPVRGALGRAPLVDAGPERDRDARGRRRGRAPRPLRDRGEPGGLGRGHPPRGEGARPAGLPGGARTCSSRGRRSWRTSCCRRPPAGARRRAR